METYIATQKKNSFPSWRNLILILVFFTITPIALGTSLFSLTALSEVESSTKKIVSPPLNLLQQPQSGIRVYASLPSSFPSVSGETLSADARSEIIRQYLADYNSPLEPFSAFLVETADKYELDYRLLTAIAQQESNLCKKIPPGSYNCWGWGIHSEGTLMFNSFTEGIEIVSRGVRENYLDLGFVTIEEIMGKYTPLSKGSWAFGVEKFMNEMQ